MKVIKSRLLFDGIDEKRDCFIGFENDEIKYVGNSQPKENSEIIAEGIVVTPAFIDSHSHIGMVRSGEPDKEEEANEHMNSVYPLANALHSIYMDDPSFKESVESGVLYSTVLPGSGNIIAGNAVLIRNFVQDIGQAHIMDVGIKAALGYNPRSTVDWKGNRPSTRMGAVAILRENFIKAKKLQKLLETEKKVIDEVEPFTELFMDILSKRLKMMVHVHKEDDIMVLLQLIKEFGIKVIANHCVDVHREEVFTALKASSVPVIYGPMDSFPYKVELKHESWRNAEKLLNSGAKFSIMSDHPVILQRNILYSLRHLLRFGLSKADAISKISKEAAEIIGAQNIGQVRAGFKASIVVWNGDPFSLSSYPILVIGEGRTVYEEE
ncbi:MAG TPA: amidohydrolase family protein [Nitrososphaeraceae archaeon]|jgi:imidazolonepropionase-like amidohydrolase|nr:amidohydrolase family protein [Nitrososphaeraceae archaeon]